MVHLHQETHTLSPRSAQVLESPWNVITQVIPTPRYQLSCARSRRITANGELHPCPLRQTTGQDARSPFPTHPPNDTREPSAVSASNVARPAGESVASPESTFRNRTVTRWMASLCCPLGTLRASAISFQSIVAPWVTHRAKRLFRRRGAENENLARHQCCRACGATPSALARHSPHSALPVRDLCG